MQGSSRAQSRLSEEMFDMCFYCSELCSCLYLLKEKTCKKNGGVGGRIQLHSMDGSTPAIVLLLHGVIKKKRNSSIIHFLKRSLQCKVTVLIYLAVQTMKTGENKKRKGTWCHEERWVIY